MLELRRTVRLVINPGFAAGQPGRNGYGGKPAMTGLGRYYEFEACCTGEADTRTGYLINIKDIDRAVRETIEPPLVEACRSAPESDPVTLLPGYAERLAAALDPVRLRSLAWRLTPSYGLEVQMPTETNTKPAVLMRQRFDFAAAHRLHAPHLSDEENRATFGRCNNPSGHGHNYQVEPCVAIEPGAGFTLADLERITDDTVIDPFDHTHLNEDTEAFRTGSGLNPSVENIARVFFERLGPAIAAAGAGIALRSVTVWETDRTSCTYPG